MSRILKGLFFAVGAGLAIGLTSIVKEPRQQGVTLPSPAAEDEGILSVEPLLDRMERVEAEMDRRGREFEKLVERQVSERVSVFERTLLEQSISIRTMRETAETSDAKMQRLVVAVERLCESTHGPAAPSPSFEAHLERALENPQPQQEFRSTL